MLVNLEIDELIFLKKGPNISRSSMKGEFLYQ